MRTMKWLVSLLIVVLILGIGAPFLIGVWIQKIFPKVFLAPSNPSSLQMTLVEYKRGIFSSTAKVALNFDQTNPSKRIIFNETIQHGPLVFENGPILALALMNAKSDDPNFQAHARTIWKLNKHVDTTISIPTVDVSNPSMHFSLQNLNLQINYHSVHEMLKSTATADRMEIQTSTPSPFTLNITKLSSAQNIRKNNNIWYGSRSGTINELIVKTAQGSLAEVHDLSFNASVSETSDKTNVQLNYQTKNSNILNTPINSIDFAFSINNIDTNALSNVIEKAVAKKASPSPMSTRELSDSALSLIGKGVLVKLDRFSMNTPQGVAKAEGQMYLPPLAGNIFQLITSIKVDFDLQIPRETLLSILTAHYQNSKSRPAIIPPATFAQQQMDEWIQSKLLIPSSDNLLIMKVQFENAKLLVNGVEQHQPSAAPAVPVVATPPTVKP